MSRSAPEVLAPWPTGRLTRRAVSVRARVRRHELQAALADGADPWSSAELMRCAAQLTSLDSRRRLAAAIDGLPTLTERAALRDLADRLRAPAPVSVAGVALVAGFVREVSTRPPGNDDGAAEAIHRAIGRCWDVLPPACPAASA